MSVAVVNIIQFKKPTPDCTEGPIISIEVQLSAMEIMHSLITQIERELGSLGVAEIYMKICESASDRYVKLNRFCKCLSFHLLKKPLEIMCNIVCIKFILKVPKLESDGSASNKSPNRKSSLLWECYSNLTVVLEVGGKSDVGLLGTCRE